MPILQKISAKLSPNDQGFAIQRNSDVANAILNTLISAVNSMQNAIHQNMDVDAFKSIREEINKAKFITAKLLNLKLDAETEARVRQNLSTIQDICASLAEVKTGDSFGEQLGGCFKNIIIYAGIILLINLIFG